MRLLTSTVSDQRAQQTRCLQMKRMPSASSAKNRPRSSRSASRAAGAWHDDDDERGRHEEARCIQSTARRSRRPRRRGRRRSGHRRAASSAGSRHGCRSHAPSRTSASSTRSGRSAARAVAPGRRAVPRRTRAQGAPRARSPPSCRGAGSRRRRPALARSATTLVVRNPSRSTIDPPKNAARTIGRKLKKTASAVSAALPVVVRTNHGIASCATALPDEGDRRQRRRARRAEPACARAAP